VTHLIATLGLPGSGKSTWAKEYADARPAGAVFLISKDDLRAMLHNGRWQGHKTEGQIIVAQETLIRAAAGMSRVTTVIVHDTNFGHLDRLEELARELGMNFHVQDFTDVDIKTCIERDLARPNSVGHKVINKMAVRHLAKPHQPPTFDPALPSAIIVDIDGTLAHMNGRSPYDYGDIILTDTVDEVIRDLVNAEHNAGTKVVIVSGRKAIAYENTAWWLKHKGIEHDELYMRADGDDRKDSIVKSEILDEHILGRYNIKYVLDDRDQVVEMWRQRGLKVLQVADGDF